MEASFDLDLRAVFGEIDALLLAIETSTVPADGGRRVPTEDSGKLLSRRWSSLAFACEIATMAVYHPAGTYQPPPLAGADAVFAGNGPRGPVPVELATFLANLRKVWGLGRQYPKDRHHGPRQVLHRFAVDDVIPQEELDLLHASAASSTTLTAFMPGAAAKPAEAGPQGLMVIDGLPDRVKRALTQYGMAEAQWSGGGRLTDRAAYDWLHDRLDLDDLPAFETWTKYLRDGRRATGQSKYGKGGAFSTRSIIRPDDA